MRVTIAVILVGLLLCLYIGLSHAQQAKKVPCEVSLAEKTIQAKNLDDDRDAKEQRLATLQTQLYFEQQTRKQLEERIKELEKPKEDKKAD